jgi:hypothetical protein
VIDFLLILCRPFALWDHLGLRNTALRKSAFPAKRLD